MRNPWPHLQRARLQRARLRCTLLVVAMSLLGARSVMGACTGSGVAWNCTAGSSIANVNADTDLNVARN